MHKRDASLQFMPDTFLCGSLNCQSNKGFIYTLLKKIKMVLQSITIHQVESAGFQICTSSILKNVPCSSFLARAKFHHNFSIIFLYCSLISKISKGFIHQIFVLIQNNIIIIAAFIKIAACFKKVIVRIYTEK